MPDCWKMRSHLGKFYGGDYDTDSTVTDIPPSSGSETRIDRGFDPVVADNTVSILRSTIAERICIGVEELLAAANISLSGGNSLMSFSILRAL